MPNSSALSTLQLDIQFQTLEATRNATVLGSLLGRTYQDVAANNGARVRVTTPQILVASAYDPAVTTTTYSTAAATTQDLVIDQTHYIGTRHHDIEKIVIDNNTGNPFNTVSAYAAERGYALAQIVDATLAAQYTAFGIPDIAIDLRDTSTASATAVLSRAQRNLRERNIPQDGRAWMVVSPAMAERIQNSLKNDALIGGIERFGVLPDSALAQAYLGTAYGFRVFMSNNLVDADGAVAIQRKMLYGHPKFWEAAFVMGASEEMREQTKLADLRRDSIHWGHKILVPNAFGTITGQEA